MMPLYKVFTSLASAIVRPLGQIKFSNGDELWGGRYGLTELSSCDLWLHAASVGESRVASYLIDYLLHQRPEMRIHQTVMTRTGYETACKLTNEYEQVSVSFLPLDALGPLRRTLSALKPKMIVITETEIWPNLVTEATRQSIPLVMINARMSEKAAGRYQMIKSFVGNLLKTYDRFFFKTEQDQYRYQQFGITSDRSEVAGDMKFDAPLLPRSEGRIAELRHRLGATPDDFVMVAGSTRPTEEVTLSHLFETIRRSRPAGRAIKLVLAPRHIERTDEIKALLDDKNLPYSLYGDAPSDKSITLVSQLGLLNDLYLAADLAFVGGTLVDIGGHNILEPVWAGTPVVYGPHLENVLSAAEYIGAHNYGCVVQSVDELAEVVNQVMTGEKTFERKTESDMKHSPTAIAGDYILKRLNHA